jgi:hypothetical protein
MIGPLIALSQMSKKFIMLPLLSLTTFHPADIDFRTFQGKPSLSMGLMAMIKGSHPESFCF